MAAASEELRVERGTFSERILLTGQLVAEEAVGLVAPNVNIWPLTIRFLAEDGIEVQAGQKVVEFDNAQLVSSLDELKARVIEQSNQLVSLRARQSGELTQARMELTAKEAQVAKTALDAQIPREVLKEKDYNDHQLAHQKAQLELERAQEDLDAKLKTNASELRLQELRLIEAEEELRRSESRIEALSLTAPKDGILILDQNREGRQFQEGDTVFPGRALARLPNLSTLLVEAQLFDVDDGKIDRGMRVRATLDAFPEDVYTGQVQEIDTVAQQLGSRSLRRSFRVRIGLEDLDVERMRPGMSVKVEVDTEPIDEVLLIPRQALAWREDEPPIGGPRARLANGSWTDVELGPCHSTHCVLLSGLEEGARLKPSNEERRAGP